MSIAQVLRDPSLESLLALGIADLATLAGALIACVTAVAALLIYVRRQPVYIPPTLRPPVWRRRITHRIGAAALVTAALVILL